MARQQREAEFRADVIRTLRGLGYLATAIRRSDGVTIGDVGLPDVVAVHERTGAMLALELKVEGRQPTAAQQRWLAALGRHAATTAIVLEPEGWPDVARRAAELAGHRVSRTVAEVGGIHARG